MTASIVWAAAISYYAAVTIKSIIPDWTFDEQSAQLILAPIFDVWTGTIVLGLLTAVLRKPVWGDASIQPGASHATPAMAQAQNSGYGPQYPQQVPPPQGYPQQGYPQQQLQQQQPYGYPQQQPQYGYPQPQAQPKPEDGFTAPQQQQQPHVYHQ